MNSIDDADGFDKAGALAAGFLFGAQGVSGVRGDGEAVIEADTKQRLSGLCLVVGLLLFHVLAPSGWMEAGGDRPRSG